MEKYQFNNTNMNKLETIKLLISKGMSYRRIGGLFGFSHTYIKDINKKYKIELLNYRACVLCGNTKNLIDDEYVTICKKCFNKIKSY